MASTEKKLSKSFKLSYGIGHVFNDLCASMWFTYLLVYFEKVVQFSPSTAGLLLLVGQLADGFSTPIVGIFSDKENRILICAKYGKRKIWHAIGTCCVLFSFPFIFSPCLGCQESSLAVQIGYYCAFVVLFQFGWACVQISHLALIPELTESKHQKTELISVRYAFTVLSNLAVYTVTFLFLRETTNIDKGMSMITTDMPLNSTETTFEEFEPKSSNITPADGPEFRNIALICVIIGTLFTVVFHVGVEEPVFKRTLPTGVRGVDFMSKRDWFKKIIFYQVAILYMATRLYVNLYQVYIPLYVEDTLALEKSAVASVPFVIYLAGFSCAYLMEKLNKRFGRKVTFVLGYIIGLSGCIGIYFGSSPAYKLWGVYIVSALLGIGGSTLLITCLSLTADIIGNNVETGAFVYAFMSFVDKVSNGIVIVIIQNMTESGGRFFYRDVIAFACGTSCVVGLTVILSMRLTTARSGSSTTTKTSDDSIESQKLESNYSVGVLTNKSVETTNEEDTHEELTENQDRLSKTRSDKRITNDCKYDSEVERLSI